MPERKQDIVVGVTGFGPFRKDVSFNTSSLLRDALPTIIERPGKPKIRILKYPVDLLCTYSNVKDAIPEIWSGRRLTYEPQKPDGPLKLDFVLHMGMTTSDTTFAIEKLARKEGYKFPGVDGVPFPREDCKKGGCWGTCPAVLHSGFDIDKVQARVEKEVPDVPSETSENAGLYFCEYIYYSSLAALHQQSQPAKVVFLHVPQDDAPEMIEKGVKLGVSLISALADEGA